MIDIVVAAHAIAPIVVVVVIACIGAAALFWCAPSSTARNTFFASVEMYLLEGPDFRHSTNLL